jgi:hypothetical protein
VRPLAPTDQRAGVLSIIFIVSYAGIGIPSVIAGIRIVHVGVLTTAREFGIVVITLAAIALLALARKPREQRITQITGASGAEPDVMARAGCAPVGPSALL